MQKLYIQLLCIFFILLLSQINGRSEETNTKERSIEKLINQIEKNYFSFDTTKGEGLLNELLSFRANQERPSYLDYLIGLEYHILGKIYYVPDPDKAESYFEKSIDYLEGLIDNDKTDENKQNKAEQLALLSSAYGKKASFSTITALYWGYKSKDAYYEAYDLDSNNRKVLLIGAIHLMHLPSAYGGDKERSEQTLKKALKLKHEQNGTVVDWGSDEELYAYLAQLEILKGNKVVAKKYIDSAFTKQKNYDFIKIDLKRQLKEL